MPKSTLRLIAVAVLFISFTGYSFIRAYDESIWFPPDPGTPPANNVAAPVNTGTDVQIKNGPLGVDTLSVTGDVGVTSVAPQIKFDDSDSSTGVWWLHNNTYGGNPSRMHFLYDRSLNGIWDAADGNPVFIAQPGADVNGTQDEISTNGEVHAGKYCDANGNNCSAITDLGGGTGGDGASCRIDVKNSVGCGNPAPCPSGYVAVGPTWGGQTCSNSGNNTVTQSCVATICTGSDNMDIPAIQAGSVVISIPQVTGFSQTGSVNVQFPTPFAQVPKVTVAIKGFTLPETSAGQGGYDGYGASVDVSNITSTGFTIRGNLLGTKATNIETSWIAVSN